jgi:rabenosyn-5
MDEFAAIRRKTVDKQYLEISRLEKRLSKLTQLLANPPLEEPGGGGSSILWPLTGAKAQQRSLEQTVIAWEVDASVPKCPFCQQEFSTYTFRRHHCRTCGRVVCGDPRTDCSANVGLNVAARKSLVYFSVHICLHYPATNKLSEKGNSANQTISLDVRICKDCRHTLFSKADFDKEISIKPPDQRSYENLVQFERGIRMLLPKFQKLLQALQNPDESPTHEQVMQATKVRKRLTDSFVQYENAARRIRDLPTTSNTQERLQKALYQQASTFLHLHMLPLKSLPKILKHASPHGASSRTNGNASSKPNGGGALASVRYNDLLETGSQASSTRSSAIESMEAEEKELRERLIVLEEQKFMVSEMLSDARKKRRFEEVQALSGNVDELTKEVDNIQGQLAGLDFAGVYAHGALDGGVPAER